MSIDTTNDYFQQKKALFKECLSLSEELISSLEDWESLSDILSKRELIIQQLESLEVTFGKEAAASLPEEMKTEIDQLIKLILDVDKDTANLIRKEQQNIINSLKANTQEQKLVQYGSIPMTQSGRMIDYKK